jgi:hypothetical protein
MLRLLPLDDLGWGESEELGCGSRRGSENFLLRLKKFLLENPASLRPHESGGEEVPDRNGLPKVSLGVPPSLQTTQPLAPQKELSAEDDFLYCDEEFF